jgi:hypothetical protein
LLSKPKKEKRAAELHCQQRTLQNDEKRKRAAELAVANKEICFPRKENAS